MFFYFPKQTQSNIWGWGDVVARARSPNRDKALQIYLEHNGNIANRKIADLLGEKEKTISNWKSRDQWNVVLQKGECSTTNKKESNAGAPKGNKNAKGNRGGAAPKRNSNAVSHGFFRTIFPDDEETMQIVEAIQEKSPVDIIWENIVIKYTAIARAQKIMFVRDQDDITEHLKKQKSFSSEHSESEEVEYEIQFAWDKQATFLNAQSRAMGELRGLIKDFLLISGQDDLRRTQLEKMQKDMEKTDLELEQLKAGEEKGVTEVVVKRWSNNANNS